jgi:threonine/homoserine/homoserine lactone efflux protein
VPELELPLSLPALVAMGFFVSLATVLIPGPVTLVASRLTITRSVVTAVWFLLGAVAVDVVLFSALAAGMAPVLRRIGALPVVELVGGLALVWGGFSSLRDTPDSRQSTVEVNGEQRSVPRLMLLGALLSLGNPHYWLWWVTGGLAFVEAARAHGEPGLAWMLAALIGGVVAWYIPVIWAVHRGKVLLSKRAEHWVMVAIAGVLLALGLGLTAIGGWRLYLRHLVHLLHW